MQGPAKPNIVPIFFDKYKSFYNIVGFSLHDMSNLTTEVDNLISKLCTDDGYVHNNIEGGQGNHFHSIKINQLVDIID